MPQSAKAILHQALELPSNDRAALVEGLIASLDQPNPALDAMWLKEAEGRLAAYRAGELEAIDAERVFADLGKQEPRDWRVRLKSNTIDKPNPR